jgi:hypothetical protein
LLFGSIEDLAFTEIFLWFLTLNYSYTETLADIQYVGGSWKDSQCLHILPNLKGGLC